MLMWCMKELTLLMCRGLQESEDKKVTLDNKEHRWVNKYYPGNVTSVSQLSHRSATVRFLGLK